jgi:hypothetical protein
VDKDDCDNGDYFPLLFRNKELVKIVPSVKGTVDIDDMAYIVKWLEAPALSRDQIRAELKDDRQTREKYKGGGNLPPILGYIFGPLFLAKQEKEYPLNEELRERYDGCRASLGMTVKEIDGLYGNPLRVFFTKSGLRAHVYGDHRYLGNVSPTLLFSYIAVVFDSNGGAVKIFSDRFFDDNWDPGMPELQRR